MLVLNFQFFTLIFTDRRLIAGGVMYVYAIVTKVVQIAVMGDILLFGSGRAEREVNTCDLHPVCCASLCECVNCVFFICTCIYCICMCMHIYIYICKYPHLGIYVYVCVYISIYIYTYTCVCMYIYILVGTLVLHLDACCMTLKPYLCMSP